MKILNGKKISREIFEDIHSKTSEIEKRGLTLPTLAIIEVGRNKESEVYIRNKIHYGVAAGIKCKVIHFDENESQKVIISKIKSLNKNKLVTGIIVQLPLPPGFNSREIIDNIVHEKDVDGLTSKNLSMLLNNQDGHIIPATSRGILKIMDYYKIPYKGKKIAILGRSTLVGKSTALTMLNNDATVKVCHSKTLNLKDQLKNQDIIISAVGKPGVINNNLETKNKIIIDVGITVKNNRIYGDVKLGEDKKKQLKAITPVPGGVGPMTVASLFMNVLDAYYKNNKIKLWK